jgi:hypothetical protein
VRDALRPKISKLDVSRSDAQLIEGVGMVLKQRLLAREREFFRFHLLYGGPQDMTEGRQKQLAELLERTLAQKGFAWSPTTIKQLALSAKAKGRSWHALSHHLLRIQTSESVLAPTAALFTYLLGLDGKVIKEVANRIRGAWGAGLRSVTVSEFRELHSELGSGDPMTGDRWVAIAEALATGAHESLLALLIEQNSQVMASRGGAPWIETRNGKLHVHFRDEQGSLPKQSDVPTMWRFPYFLDSLRSVANALKEHSG